MAYRIRVHIFSIVIMATNFSPFRVTLGNDVYGPHSVFDVSPDPITDIVANYPEAGQFTFISRGSSPETYSFTGGHSFSAVGSIFRGASEQLSALPPDKVAFLHRQDLIVWDTPTDTARLLRPPNAFGTETYCFSTHATFGTIAQAGSAGMVVWSADTLGHLWAPAMDVQMSLSQLGISRIDATRAFLICGDPIGNLWELRPKETAKFIRECPFPNWRRMHPSEVQISSFICTGLAIIDENRFLFVGQTRSECTIEVWNRAVLEEEQGWVPAGSTKVENESLTLVTDAAMPGTRQYHLFSDACIYRFNPDSVSLHRVVCMKDWPEITQSEIRSIALSRESQEILTGHQNGTVRRWRTKVDSVNSN